MFYSADYSTLLGLIIQLVQSQTGQRFHSGEEWLNDAQTLSVKLFRHLVSMERLAEGATVEQNNSAPIFFIDHASVKIVIRAALETYLVFFYLYGSADRLVSEFRHKTWRLGGLFDRQKFHASNANQQQVLFSEKEQIEALISEINASPQLQTYPEKQRAQLLKGNWRISNDWSDLGVQAGFPKQYFQDVYGYLYGYSHSSYLSALQVGQASSIEDQFKLTQGILSIGIAIMAHFAFSYSSTFSSAASVLEKHIEGKRVAEKWRFRPENNVPQIVP